MLPSFGPSPLPLLIRCLKMVVTLQFFQVVRIIIPVTLVFLLDFVFLFILRLIGHAFQSEHLIFLSVIFVIIVVALEQNFVPRCMNCMLFNTQD